MNQAAPTLFLVLFVSFFFFVLSLFWFHSYTGRRDTTFLAVIGSLIVGVIFSIHRARATALVPTHFHDRDFTTENAGIIFGLAASVLLYPFMTALALRLWGRWIGGDATEAERLPGIEGIRAWFCSANVTVGALIVFCAWLGEDISPLLTAVVIGALLAAAPVLRREFPLAAAAPASPAGEDLSAEREKIVSMLEAGKLTAEESAELLQALGESARPAAARAVPLTGGQRLMLIGAGFVALGFFLPWFVINPGKELGQVTQNMQSSISNVENAFVGQIQLPDVHFVQGQFKTGDISLSGGDIQRGLGWVVLALALGAALVPYVATTLDADTARTVRLLCLGLGSLIVLYLVTQNIRFVSIGLIIAVAGYVVEIAGAIRERRSAT